MTDNQTVGVWEFGEVSAWEVLTSGSYIIASYQRPLVWSKKKEREYIKWCHENKGIPLIDVFVHRDDPMSPWKIANAQQRFSAFHHYMIEPSYFIGDISDLANEVLAILFPLLEASESKPGKSTWKIAEECIRKAMDRQDKDNINFLRDLLIEKLELTGMTINEGDDLNAVQLKVDTKVLDFLDLRTQRCFVTRYTGPEAVGTAQYIAMNSQNVSLTKHDVVQAKWNEIKIAIPDTQEGNEILEIAIRAQADRQAESYLPVDGCDEAKTRQTRTIKLFELYYALGEWICSNTPTLFAAKDRNKKKTVGADTLAIVFGIRVQDTDRIRAFLPLLQDQEFLADMLAKIFEEYRVIDANLSPMLRKIGNDKDAYDPCASALLASLTLFADSWTARYGIVDSQIQAKRSNTSIYERIKKNLPISYVRNITEGITKTGGDNILNSFYYEGESGARRTNAATPSREAMRASLLRWAQSDFDRAKSSGSISKDTKTMLTIASSLHRDDFNQGLYDIEHMFDQKALKSADAVAGNALGNLFCLGVRTNRGKKNQSLYALPDSHDGMELSQSYLDNIHYPSKSEYDIIKENIENGDGSLANEAICSRGKKLVEDILDVIYANQSE